MSDDERFWFSTVDRQFEEPPKEEPPKKDCPAVWLRLQRYQTDPPRSAPGQRKPVLLLHGASANHRTFTVGDTGLASWLYAAGFDPWLLDWRGSSLVVERENAEHKDNRHSLRDLPEIYNFNRAASEDLPAAIRRMRLEVKGPISVLGHCMGSAVVAEAVALKHISAVHVDRIVLMTLGLFYEAPIDSRLKSEERILERLTQAVEGEAVLSINPRIAEIGTDWPRT